MTNHVEFKIDPATKMDGRKISPGGVITLPFAARLALRFVRRKPAHLDIVVEHEGVKLVPSAGPGPDSVRSSPRGLLRLPPAAYRAIAAKGERRYRLTIDARQHEVRLQPA
jgi:hypothetical protein